jgi:hypothetical protein
VAKIVRNFKHFIGLLNSLDFGSLKTCIMGSMEPGNSDEEAEKLLERAMQGDYITYHRPEINSPEIESHDWLTQVYDEVGFFTEEHGSKDCENSATKPLDYSQPLIKEKCPAQGACSKNDLGSDIHELAGKMAIIAKSVSACTLGYDNDPEIAKSQRDLVNQLSHGLDQLKSEVLKHTDRDTVPQSCSETEQVPVHVPTGISKRRRAISQKREHFNSQQTELLLHEWNNNTKPSLVERSEMAEKIGCDVKQVDEWFKNRRNKLRLKSKLKSS